VSGIGSSAYARIEIELEKGRILRTMIKDVWAKKAGRGVLPFPTKAEGGA